MLDKTAFKVDESYKNEVYMEVALLPKAGSGWKPQIFYIGLKRRRRREGALARELLGAARQAGDSDEQGLVPLQAMHSRSLARDERRRPLSSVASIPFGIEAPCVLGQLAPRTPGTRPHHLKRH